MKNLTLVLVLVLIGNLSIAQTQKSLLKTFNPNGNDQVVLKLDGEVSIEKWSNEFIRVQMTIDQPNGDSNILKSLIARGRYNLNSTTENGAMVIYSAERLDNIKVRGRMLEETVTYKVFVPESMLVDDGKAATEANIGETTELGDRE